jgi:hypothetical protein
VCIFRRCNIVARIQVLLSRAQNEKLSYLAKRIGTTKSGLIRDAVDKLLKERVPEDSDPLLELIGQAGKAGKTDISVKHDSYLAEKEAGGWGGDKSS